MLVPLSWLKDFVDLKIPTEKIAEKLVLSGTKIEATKKVGAETVFDFEITPNRGDQLSVLGIARELSALFGKRLQTTVSELLLPPGSNQRLKLNITQKDLCPGYSLVVLSNIKVKQSSKWIQNYLTLSGIRPLNNVIDITNLVMLELGQPMHAFDRAKIKGEMKLRASKAGETIETLDQVKRELPKGSIVIEDETKLIDLAGLMGGKSSDISQETSEIILLAPIYHPVAIRRTSLATGLRTEASSRFEKGIDPNLHPQAIMRAIELLIPEASAKLKSPVTTIGAAVVEKNLTFDTTLVTKILGLEIDTAEIINLLSPLGFRCQTSALRDNTLEVKIPSWRLDISLPEDLLEEIGRIYGYNRFPKTLPKGELPLQKEIFESDLESNLRSLLLNSGFNETTGYSLVSSKDLTAINLKPESTLKVLHPTSQDFEFLRPTLFISLIKAVLSNLNHENLNFFEIAKIFDKEIDKKTNLPLQTVQVSFVSAISYPQVKGAVDSILLKFKDINLSSQRLTDNPFLVEGLLLTSDKVDFATIGQVKPEIVRNFGSNKNIWAASLDFSYLESLKAGLTYRSVPKFPPVKEDISFFVDQSVLASTIVNSLKSLDRLIYQLTIKDALSLNKRKSLTLHIEYISPTSTLTTNQIVKTHNKIVKYLQSQFKAEIRD